MRAVISVLCFQPGCDCLAQNVAQHPGIAVDGNLLEARCRARQDPDPGLRHTKRFGQQLRYRAIGLAAFGNGADPNFDHGAAIGERLNSVDVVAAAARRDPQRDADALGGIAPRIVRDQNTAG